MVPVESLQRPKIKDQRPKSKVLRPKTKDQRPKLIDEANKKHLLERGPVACLDRIRASSDADV